MVATYPPRRCGIATFTSDLARATGASVVVALAQDDDVLEYPAVVRHVIRKEHRDDYRRAATALNGSVDVASVQHEYGIWGGEDGELVVDFLQALRVPAVLTMHTVLPEPTTGQRTILARAASLAAASVVMSNSAARLLVAEYGVNADRVRVIPHGVPDRPLVRSGDARAALGLGHRPVILSFGLLGPGKGYELAIDSLPAVVAEHPDALYVILGATHPDLIKREGEAYRGSLVDQVARLGLTDHVRFVDRFAEPAELGRWLGAADIFVTPYPNLAQIVSGTLSYAMGAGRAIVSTPYTYAVELLADGRGLLVPPASPAALAAALGSLIGDPALRAGIGRRAFEYSRRMLWPAVGREYRTLFGQVAIARLATRTLSSALGVAARA